MRINLQADRGKLEAYLTQQAEATADAADAAVRFTTEETKKLGRVQVGAALSPRAANTLTSRFYLGSREGGRQGVAGYVHGRWFRRSAAGRRTDILAEYETGATITPKRGTALAIPLRGAGRFGLSALDRRTRVTPASFERQTGLELRLVQRPGKNPILVTDGTRAPRILNSRGDFVKRKKGSRYAAWVPVFVLVRQSRLPKRLDFTQLRRKAGDDLARRVLIEMGKRDR